MPFSIELKRYQKRVERSLKKNLPPLKKAPRILHEAMHYAVLNGGKRLRAMLIYALGDALGAPRKALDQFSAAIEMLHAYSLIHDDLPALDNDDLRRGKPTCHKVYGEATAILAGNALQSLAFEILSDPKLFTTHTKSDAATPSGEHINNQLRSIFQVAKAIGSQGLIGGEHLDLAMEKLSKQHITIKTLEKMYQMKTGRLLTLCIQLAALAANYQNRKSLNQLMLFGDFIGLAFQIHDDLIGIESDTATLGKTQGSDSKKNKPIYPSIMGVEKAKQKEKLLYRKAIACLDKIKEDTTQLRMLAAFVIERNY